MAQKHLMRIGHWHAASYLSLFLVIQTELMAQSLVSLQLAASDLLYTPQYHHIQSNQT
jgi:hypothetical protein